MDFIKTLFTGTNDLIEIREIGESGAKSLFYSIDDIDKYSPPISNNVYFGLYTRTRKKGSKEYCKDTGALWADFDGFGAYQTLNQKVAQVEQSIKEADLPEPSMLVNSGNGIHAYWLLNQRAGSEAIPIVKAIALKTGADMRATDKARIMRLPNSLNLKGLIPQPCKVLKNKGYIYDLRDFNNRLTDTINKLPKPEIGTNKDITGALIKDLKPDRSCIASILNGVTQGNRNFALGRLTRWLEFKGYSKSKARAIVIEWNTRNRPSEDTEKLLNDFNIYWNTDYKLLGCTIKNPELHQTLMGLCDRQNCNIAHEIGEIIADYSVSYNNRLLNDITKLSGLDLAIYGLLLRHPEGLTTSQLEEKANISRPTVYRRTDTLKKLGVLEAIKGQNKTHETLYRVKDSSTYGLGYTKISNGAISGAINKIISPRAFKVYVMLNRYSYGKEEAHPSLATLSKDLRMSMGNISNILKELEEKDYIKRIYKENKKGYLSLECRLLI